GYCEDKDSLESLCSKIHGDAQLYSLFRLDAAPEECPFTGAPFTFTYNRGYGECKSPVSHVDTCTENSRLLLRYQACPDVLKTESTVEELQCMAQWREGSQQYLVGRIHHRLSASFEDTYRCFVFEKIKGHGQHGQVTGYKMAMSGDATCTGVSSPTEGARTLTFTKAEANMAKCKFPGWFSSHKWHTLDGKLTFKTAHKNTTFHIAEENRRNVSGQNALNMSAGKIASFLASGSRVTCQSFKEFSEKHIAILTHHVVGCKSELVCIHMYKRDRHVMEMQMRQVLEGEEDFVCNNSKAMNTGMPFVTLVSAERPHHRCPYLGKYAATGVTQDGRVVRDACGPALGQAANFQTLVVGCGDSATMEFHSTCPNQEQSTAFECHGSWEEGGTGFLIASPLSRSSTTARRYCFIYTSEPEGNLRVSSSSESCKRNPGVEGTWAFNLTVEGQCAEAVRAGCAPSPTVAVIPVLVMSLTLLLSTSSLVKSLLRVQPSPAHSVFIQR
ncbi:unnamed protein product, partial [Allacma fusca]